MNKKVNNIYHFESCHDIDVKNDEKYSCIPWLHEVRKKILEDTSGMTSAEIAAYYHEGAERAIKKMRKLTPEQGRKELRELLHAEKAKTAEPSKKPARRKSKKQTASL